MSPPRPRAARRAALIGIAVSVVAFAALLWAVDPIATFQALATIDLVWLLPAGGLVAAAWIAQARRWAATLPDTPRLGTWRLARLILIGLFGNLVLPLRGGDLVRVALTSRALGGQPGRAIASVAVDRAMDVVALLALAVVAGLLAPLPVGWSGALVTVAVGTLGAATAAIGIAAWPDLGHRAIATLAPVRLRDSLGRIFGQLTEGLREVGRPGRAARVVLWSTGQWVLNGAAIWCCLIAFEPTISFPAAMLFMVATSLGTALPSAPSGVGVYHAAGVLALAPLGIEAERAMAMALVAHAYSVVLQLGGGALAVAIEGGFSTLREPPVAEGEA